MFDRIASLIGSEKLDLIRTKSILVIGAGGVGGYVIEGLIRSGIESICVIDFDKIDVTNLNRQIIALSDNINHDKTDEIRKRCLSINENVKINVINEKITYGDIPSLELSKYDYVVDAIDDIKVKIELIKYSLDNDINLISSMGTAKKVHPELLSITTLDKTYNDPIARVLRSNLKGYKMNRIKVLSSTEKPMECKNLGSMIFVPAVAGLLIANYIINDICGF